MLLILKPEAKPESIQNLADRLQSLGFIVQDILEEHTHMLLLAGDTTYMDCDQFARIDIVDSIMKVSEPYKLAGRKFHPDDTVIDVCGQKIGGNHFAVIAGPCSVESEAQILAVAESVKASGAAFIRGGAFKPRTSPYTFQGLGLDGLELLKKARQKTGLPVVSEIMNNNHLEEFQRDVDIIQIGARNMQNFSLLREVGQLKKPVLIKRGLANTVDELLMAAEHLMVAGAKDIILCERGIRTFETATRNTLDLSAVPILHKKTHLPVIVDPSHGTGSWTLVEPMALAAVAAGADGLMIEVHNQPEAALCDGSQSLTPENFEKMMKKIFRIREVIAE